MVAPAQYGPVLDALGVAGSAVMVIVIPEEVAGLPTTPAKLDVITQVTICPVVNVVVVNVAAVAPPTFTPFTCH